MFSKLPSTTTTSVTVLLFAIICKTFFSRGKHFREITPQSLNLLVECTQFLAYLFYFDHFFSVTNFGYFLTKVEIPKKNVGRISLHFFVQSD